MLKKSCPPAGPCGCVIVERLPVGMNALRPIFAQIVNTLPITLNIGTSCDNPIWSKICNVPGSPIETVAIGAYSNNTVDPGPYHFQVLAGLANAAAPTLTEGKENLLSLDLDGNLRVIGTFSFPANAPVNISQINGITPLMGNGVTGTGSPRVTIASDNNPFSVNANAGTNLNTSLLALESTQAKLTLTQGSATAAQTGPLIQGAVTTLPPTYTTTQTAPLSLNTDGDLRVTDSDTAAYLPQIAIYTSDIKNQSYAPGVATAGLTGTLIQGAVTTAAPSYTNGQLNLLSLDTAGNLRVAGTLTLAANQSVNVAQIAGTATSVNNGAADAGTQRVTIANNSTGILAGVTTVGTVTAVTTITNALPTGVNILGKVGIDQTTVGTTNKVHVGTWGATVQPVATDNGITQSGTLRVTLSNNSTGVIAGITNMSLVQGSTIIGQVGPLIQGSVTTAAPSYTTATVSPLSIDTSGNLRVLASIAAGSAIIGNVRIDQTTPGTTNGVNVTSFGAGAQNVATDNGASNSGTLRVTIANNSTGVLASITALNLVQGSTTSGQTGPLIQGAVTTAAPSYTTAQTAPLSLDTSGNLRVTGTVVIASNQSVNLTQILGVAPDVNNGNVTAGTLRVTIANDSTGSLTKITNLNLAYGATTLGKTGPMVMAAVTTAAPTYITGELYPFSMDTAGNLRVTGAVTIAANQSVNVAQIAGTATDVNNGGVSAGTQRVTIANNSTGILAGVTTVSTVTAVTAITNALPAGTNAIGVVSTKTALTASAPTVASVGVASGVAVSSNANRKGLELYNTSSAMMSYAFGAPAVLYSGITLPPGGYWIMNEFSFNTAEVRAIASAAASNLGVQEYT